jgi:hypothetical protein
MIATPIQAARKNKKWLPQQKVQAAMQYTL